MTGDFRWFGGIVVGHRSCFLRRVWDRIMLREGLKCFMTNERDDGFRQAALTHSQFCFADYSFYLTIQLSLVT